MSFRPSTLTHRLLTTLNTVNATLVTNAQALVHGISGYNGGTATYLKLYDANAAPDETLTPRRTIYLPANAAFNFSFPNPLVFGSGLGYRMTTAGADNSTAAVAADAVLGLNIDYS